MVFLSRLNLYRSVRSDGTGFDTSNLHFENIFTLVAVGAIISGIIASALFYSFHKVVTGHQVTASLGSSISFAQYNGITTSSAGKLVGDIHCRCSQSVLPYGSASGGFVNNVTFALDAMCTGYGVLEPLTTHAKMNGTTYGCDRMHGLNPGLASWNTSLQPYAECAVAQTIAERILNDINALCRTADKLNSRIVDAFLLESLFTAVMMPMDILTKYVNTRLDEIAVQTGIRMFVAHDSSSETESLIVDTNGPIGRAVLQKLDLPHAYRVTCDEFSVGKSAIEKGWRHALALCIEAQAPSFIMGYCRDKMTGKVTAFKVPCTKKMVQLAVRLRASEYPSIPKAIEGAFLLGMSAERRSDRRIAMGLRPKAPAVGGASATAPKGAGSQTPPGGRRLSGDSGGFVLVAEDGEEAMFQRYFESCLPSECSYTIEDTPDGQALVVIVSGLIGGIIAAGKAIGQALLIVWTYLFSKATSSQAKSEDTPPFQEKARE